MKPQNSEVVVDRSPIATMEKRRGRESWEKKKVMERDRKKR